MQDFFSNFFQFVDVGCLINSRAQHGSLEGRRQIPRDYPLSKLSRVRLIRVYR